ncbi:hypothetical protein HPB52_013239 [Rhipicephalus sanguineus]|uniref:Uncharacterized protein n=1 Tax=Rhipicephalus sanguineus TaxID=34632 RepID=A0A9D4PF51_RHISA|nr:hypothetical protein HPB52_013239 [Rhipicephalus sanguineus]
MCGGNDALDARAVTAALIHIVKEKALPSKDMGIRDENIEEAAVSIPEDVIEELEALREPPRKPPNSVAYSGLVYVGGYIAKLIIDVEGTRSGDGRLERVLAAITCSSQRRMSARVSASEHVVFAEVAP